VDIINRQYPVYQSCWLILDFRRRAVKQSADFIEPKMFGQWTTTNSSTLKRSL